MAPPALVNLDNYSDVSFRDTVIRHQNQVAPSANIIRKLYHHVTGNTANLSAADVVSVDGSGQGQWDLMLSTAANRLNANTITTGNMTTLSANSIISVRQATTTIRSTNVIVGNLTVTGTLSSNSPSITELGTLSSLDISGLTSTTNLSVSGISDFDATIFKKTVRTLGASFGSFSEICDIDSPAINSYTVELDIVDTILSKKYLFVVSPSTTTSGNFQRLLPLYATEEANIHVEMSLVSGSTAHARLRLVRTTGAASSVHCHFKISYMKSTALDFIELDGAGTVTPVSAIYTNTALTQVRGRVGINTSAPSVPLDVVGAANVSGNVTAAHVSATSLSGILSTAAQPSITSVGTLTGLTAASALLANQTFRNLSKTLSSVHNAFSLICEIAGSNAYSFDLTIAQAVSGSSISKVYTGTMQFNSTSDNWRRLVPLSSSGPSSSKDYAVDIKVANSSAQLRLVRTDTTGTAPEDGFSCSLYIRNSNFPVTVTDLVTVGTGATSVGVYKNTLITQVDGRVGVGNDNPTAPLDVTGNINMSTGSLLLMNNTPVLSATALGSGVTSSSLTSFGNVTELTVNGPTKIANRIMRSFQRDFTTFSGASICSITNSGGAFNLDLAVAQSRDHNSVAQRYVIPVFFNATNNAWHNVVPISTSGPTANDLLLQIRVTGTIGGACTTTLRIYRILPTGANESGLGINIEMVLTQSSESPVTIVEQTLGVTPDPSTDIYTGTIYNGTLITQSASGKCVGINKLIPDGSVALDVGGSVRCPNVSFESKWRIRYDINSDALVIQRNTGNVTHTSWVTTSILAQM